MAIYMWREYVPRTFTISWEEKFDMSSGWTYSDDAAGLTAGSAEFDKFFGYSGVRLNTSGQETAEITQTASGGAGKLDITQLGTLTSGDNVMIKFPIRGIKMTKSGSIVTLSITEELDKAGYQYYAHSRGTIDNPGTPKDAFYLGAYMGYNSSNVLKSWSGMTILSDIYLGNVITMARANDGNSGSSGYDIEGFYQRMYVNALYMMKYGNPNCKSVVGLGASRKTTTGGTNSQTNATYGTNSNAQIKLFGLEDRWGNIRERLGGVCCDGSGVVYTALNGFVNTVKTSSPYLSTGVTLGFNSSGNIILRWISGTNKGMFVSTGTAGTNSNRYYCSGFIGSASKIVGAGGGYADAATYHSALSLNWSLDQWSSTGNGARLMYL